MTITSCKRRWNHTVSVYQQAMQAQNMMWPPALATAAAALLNVPVNLILIQYAGFSGAAAAFSVSRVLMLLILLGELSSHVTVGNFSSHQAVTLWPVLIFQKIIEYGMYHAFVNPPTEDTMYNCAY